MLNRVDDVRDPCAPSEYCLHHDEWKPEGPIPKADETHDADPNGCKTQFHLEAAIQRRANAGGNLIGIDDVSEQAAHDGEPAWQPNRIECDEFRHRLFAWFISCRQPMNNNGGVRHEYVDVQVQSRYFKKCSRDAIRYL
ncbi:MAG TPA: hypothetical protein VMJ90_08230 [Anaerolineales bacterium]|nr:hypothetical protein [Anaerolineales bacterium]